MSAWPSSAQTTLTRVFQSFAIFSVFLISFKSVNLQVLEKDIKTQTSQKGMGGFQKTGCSVSVLKHRFTRLLVTEMSAQLDDFAFL